MLTIQFERQRTPPEIIIFSLNLYFGFKLSLRDVEDRLGEEQSVARSREAVREWVQRTNRATRRYFAAPLPRRVQRIIVDESEVRVGGEWMWLWAALEPTRRVILEVHVSPVRNGLVARSFMGKLMEKYGRHAVFLTDGGKWYPWAARSLGARWRRMRGGVRSYIERWFRTVKDRMHVFNSAFPATAHGLTPALTFIRFYALYYNAVRPHRTLRGHTPMPTRGATRLQRLKNVLEVTRTP
jgi:transposase-like protein